MGREGRAFNWRGKKDFRRRGMKELIPYDDIENMASAMVKSGMFGKTKEQLLSLMLIAQGEGIHPAIAAMEYDVIQGKPAINSRAALSRFQAAGGTIQWIERTDLKASAKFTHPQGGELVVEWTMERAQLAGLSEKLNWEKIPAQMLSARVVAEGVRAVYPACLSRMYTVEEVQDFDIPKMRDVTPDPSGNPTPESKNDTSSMSEADIPPDDAIEQICIDIKAAIGSFVEVMGSVDSEGNARFTDDEKAEAKKKIVAKEGITKERLAYVQSIVAEYRGRLSSGNIHETPEPVGPLF
jgi:hypothetical protein